MNSRRGLSCYKLFLAFYNTTKTRWSKLHIMNSSLFHQQAIACHLLGLNNPKHL